MLTVLSWNIQAGGGSRYRQIVEAVAQKQADIVTFSEYRNNATGAKLRYALLQAGYRHQAVTDAEANTNSVLIAAKLPFQSEAYPLSDPVYGHNILTAHFAAFSLMGVYLPHKKKHSLLPFITKLVDHSDQPFIVAGDYNTGFNGIDQKGSSFWYEPELKALGNVGYVDAFRLVHQDAAEYSWYSHQGNGFRYDHTYLSTALQPIVKDCYYEHSWREKKLSDHSAMVLELG